MKNKKKILSLIACLSLLSSCNKKAPSSKSCSITTSTPTSSVTPSKTVEELNKELFENYAKTSIVNDNLRFTGFNDNIPEEYLNLETLIIPETINGIELKELHGTFSIFSKVKFIKIPATITDIMYGTSGDSSSPFVKLAYLENIEVDSNNEYYEVFKNVDGTSSNCLISSKNNNVICGWGDVIIPEKVALLRAYAFIYNKSIKTIKLHKDLIIGGDTYAFSEVRSFCYLDNLANIDPNGNTRYIVENNVLYDTKLDADTTDYKILAAWGYCKIPDSIKRVSLTFFTSIVSVDLNKTEQIRSLMYTNIKSIKIPSSVTKIDLNAFRYMSYIEDVILENGNTNFQIPKNADGTSTNCLISSNNEIIFAWGNVTIPESVISISNRGFANCLTIKSIKLSKSLATINYNNNSISIFSYINNYSESKRKLEDYFDLIDNEENPNFRVINNCLINMNTKEVLSAFPDKKTGIVTLPNEALILKAGFGYYDCNSEDIKDVIFNDALKTIETTAVYGADYSVGCCPQIKKVRLPANLETIRVNSVSGAPFLWFLPNLEELTIGDSNKNNNFRIQDNCLIQKNSDGSESLIFAYGKEAILPETVTELKKRGPLGMSLKSITIHSKINNLILDKDYNFFVAMKVETINFNGNLEELKREINVKGSTTITSISLLDAIKLDERNSNITLTYLDDSGNRVSKLVSEIK